MKRFLSVTFSAAVCAVLSAPFALSASAAAVGLPRTMGGRSLQEVIGRVISTVLGLSGVAALAVFVFSGLMYLTAQGSEEKITKAKKMMVWAALGLIVLFSSYAIVTFIQTRLTESTKSAPAAQTPAP